MYSHDLGVYSLASSTACPYQNRFRNAFFMTFRTFATSGEIFDLLIDRYRLVPPVGLSTDELEQWKEKILSPTRKRILSIFMTWLEYHRLVQDDPPIARRLQEFLSDISPALATKLQVSHVMATLERMVNIPLDDENNPFN